MSWTMARPPARMARRDVQSRALRGSGRAMLLLGFFVLGCGVLDWDIILPPEQPLPPHDGARREPNGVVRLHKPGTIHVPRPGNPNRTVDIQARGSFRRIELEVDVTHGGWFSSDPNKNHSVFWLHRGHGAFAGNAIAFVNAFGPTRNEVRLATNLTLPRGARMDAAKQRGIRLASGRTYHVRYVYDGPRGRTDLLVTERGNVVTRVVGRAPLRAIESTGDNTFFVWFGHRDNRAIGGPERPTYGWRYADLTVRFIP